MESIFWLLLHWAVGAQPKEGREEAIHQCCYLGKFNRTSHSRVPYGFGHLQLPVPGIDYIEY